MMLSTNKQKPHPGIPNSEQCSHKQIEPVSGTSPSNSVPMLSRKEKATSSPASTRNSAHPVPPWVCPWKPVGLWEGVPNGFSHVTLCSATPPGVFLVPLHLQRNLILKPGYLRASLSPTGRSSDQLLTEGTAPPMLVTISSGRYEDTTLSKSFPFYLFIAFLTSLERGLEEAYNKGQLRHKSVLGKGESERTNHTMIHTAMETPCEHQPGASRQPQPKGKYSWGVATCQKWPSTPIFPGGKVSEQHSTQWLGKDRSLHQQSHHFSFIATEPQLAFYCLNYLQKGKLLNWGSRIPDVMLS